MKETPRTGEDPAALAGATVLVTGGSGLIGSRVAARLRALGAQVITLGRFRAYPPDVYTDLFGVAPHAPGVVVGDITDRTLLRDLVSRSDYVVHAAALADVAACTHDPETAIEANISGTQALLAEVTRFHTRIRRFCFASSASVYGGGDCGRVRCFPETASPAPLSVYANTKLWGEHQTRMLLGHVGVSHAIVRYFSVYGEPQVVKPGSHTCVVAWMAMRASLGMSLRLHGEGRPVRDFVHVDDIAEATVRALTAPCAGDQVINIGTGVATPIRTLAEIILRHFPGTEVVDAPMSTGDPIGGCADTTRLRAALGWTPGVTLTEGVERYVRWLAATPGAVPAWLRAEVRDAPAVPQRSPM